MLSSGAAELLSLDAVLRFLAVLTDLQTIGQQPLVRSLTAQARFSEANAPLLSVLVVTLGLPQRGCWEAVVHLLNLHL